MSWAVYRRPQRGSHENTELVCKSKDEESARANMRGMNSGKRWFYWIAEVPE